MQWGWQMTRMVTGKVHCERVVYRSPQQKHMDMHVTDVSRRGDGSAEVNHKISFFQKRHDIHL
jgi:hypothetical protein